VAVSEFLVMSKNSICFESNKGCGMNGTIQWPMQAHAPAQMGMKQAGIAAHPSGPKAFFLEAPSPTVQFCKLLISEPLIIPEFRRSEKHSKRT
jgi:hypothetical protein